MDWAALFVGLIGSGPIDLFRFVDSFIQWLDLKKKKQHMHPQRPHNMLIGRTHMTHLYPHRLILCRVNYKDEPIHYEFNIQHTYVYLVYYDQLINAYIVVV